MPEIKVRGDFYNISPTRDSFNRRAQQYANFVTQALRRIGAKDDYIEVSEERMAMKKAPAEVSWWLGDDHCNFKYDKMSKFVDNMLVLWKVLQRQIDAVESQSMSIEEFSNMFKEDDTVEDQRKEAREFFGLDEDHVDLESVSKQYKLLAKTLHPDMPTGDINKFKELNKHHKTLKRELE